MFPVAPVGDVDSPLGNNAEAASFREAPYELYIIELELGIEAPALPEDLLPHRDTVPGTGGRKPLDDLEERVEEGEGAPYRRRRTVGCVQGTRDVQPSALELLEKALEEILLQPHVGVEEDQDIPAGVPAPQVSPRGHRWGAGQQGYPGKAPHHGDGVVPGARVDHYDLVGTFGLPDHVGEQRADVPLFVEGGDHDAQRGGGARTFGRH